MQNFISSLNLRIQNHNKQELFDQLLLYTVKMTVILMVKDCKNTTVTFFIIHADVG